MNAKAPGPLKFNADHTGEQRNGNPCNAAADQISLIIVLAFSPGTAYTTISLRLLPQTESTKDARVCVCVPNNYPVEPLVIRWKGVLLERKKRLCWSEEIAIVSCVEHACVFLKKNKKTN